MTTLKECNICALKKELVQAQCNHSCCLNCWEKIKGNNFALSCPICRANVQLLIKKNNKRSFEDIKTQIQSIQTIYKDFTDEKDDEVNDQEKDLLYIYKIPKLIESLYTYMNDEIDNFVKTDLHCINSDYLKFDHDIVYENGNECICYCQHHVEDYNNESNLRQGHLTFYNDSRMYIEDYELMFYSDPKTCYNLLYIYNNVIMQNDILKHFHDTRKITNDFIPGYELSLQLFNNSLIGNLLNVNVNDFKFKETYYDLSDTFKFEQ